MLTRCNRAAGKAILCAALAGTALLSAQSASAEVITLDFSGNPLSVVPFDLGGVYLNIATGAASISTGDVPGWDINPYFTGTGGGQPARFNLAAPTVTGGFVVAGIIPSIPAQQLAIGATVGPDSIFKDATASANSGTTDVHYFGFRFLNEATSIENYGYIAIQQSVAPAQAGSVKVLGWAYDNSGAAITVSALPVPEPSSYALLGAGIAVLAALQRRRARASALS